MKKTITILLILSIVTGKLVADSNTYLNFTAVNGPASISLEKNYEPYSISLQYSTDNCVTWFNYSIGQTLQLNSGAKVYFKATNTNDNFSGCTSSYMSDFSFYYFSMTGKITADGNVMSLLDSSMQKNNVPSYAFYRLFSGDTSLISAPSLPATTLNIYCYRDMFYGCNSLVSASVLPATTLAPGCYNGMFADCKSLVTAPALPATTLAKGCYSQMFDGCMSLTAAPTLPSTALCGSCYYGMFANCGSLTVPPSLPATTLAPHCYEEMFHGCKSLITPPNLPATVLSECCYYGMFRRCSSLATAPDLPATTLDSCCYHSMFELCGKIRKAPELPATTLAVRCYYNMFAYCGLVAIPALPATNLPEQCYCIMYAACGNLHVDTLPPGKEWQIPSNASESGINSTSGMFMSTGGTFRGTPVIGRTYYIDTIRTVTVLANNPSWGIVTGSGQYACLDQAIITATPNAGYKFAGWSNGEKNPVIKLQVVADVTITAYFIQDRSYNVTGNSNNTNWGTVTGSGIYDALDTAVLTAVPNAGSRFLYWSNGMTSDVISIRVTSDTVLTAYFDGDTTLSNVDDIPDWIAISIYPNPIHIGEVSYISIPGEDVNIEIYSIDGQCVKRIEHSTGIVAFEGIYQAGVYLIKVTNRNGKVVTKKLIIL